MKKNYMLIILTSTILGLFIGIGLKEYNYKNGVYAPKDTLVRKELRQVNKSIKKLNKSKENLEKEIYDLKTKYKDKEKIKEVENIKSMLSYTDLKDEGISIKIDGLNEDTGNIANLIDYNKILINLINEIRINGGKFISINDQRINQYSEIVLAGSHININSVPIAPPYEFKVIGDTKRLEKYIDKDSQYIKSIKNSYPLKIEKKIEKNMSMEKMNIPNKLRYIEGK